MISVIIPNYNHANYLQQRIDSVLGQTCNNFEIIILDDCSWDDSKTIIEKYRESERVRHIVYNEANSGSPFKQWKKGIELAQGDWIWIAESDDFCDNNLLATLLVNANKDNDVVLSYSQSNEADENGNLLGDVSWSTDHFKDKHWKNDFVNPGIEEINRYLLYQNTIPNASAVLFKKAAYLKADKEFESMRLCGDWMLWIELLKQGNIAFTASALNYFRSHNATTRVIDNFEKRKLRLEEEYKIVSHIKNTITNVNGWRVNDRLQRLKLEYASNFDRKKLFYYLLHPTQYKSNISYLDLLEYYLREKWSHIKKNAGSN